MTGAALAILDLDIAAGRVLEAVGTQGLDRLDLETGLQRQQNEQSNQIAEEQMPRAMHPVAQPLIRNPRIVPGPVELTKKVVLDGNETDTVDLREGVHLQPVDACLALLRKRRPESLDDRRDVGTRGRLQGRPDTVAVGITRARWNTWARADIEQPAGSGLGKAAPFSRIRQSQQHHYISHLVAAMVGMLPALIHPGVEAFDGSDINLGKRLYG